MLRNFFAAIGAFFIFIFLLLVISAGYLLSSIGGGLPDGLTKLSPGTQNVGVVEISGEIKDSKDFQKNLQRFVDNDNIKGIVVRIDSPGGAVGTSEELYRYIKKASTEKPIVCSMGNIAASGGFYASLGCDQVFASAGTLTGSIGVIMMLPNFSHVMETLGVGFNVIKTGALKDSGSPFREFNEVDRNYLEGVAGQAYEQFVGTISAERGLAIEEVKKVADGRIILGEEAKKLGLVHEIGGLNEAASALLARLTPEGEEVPRPNLVFPSQDFDLQKLFKKFPAASGVMSLVEPVSHVSFRYQLMGFDSYAP